MIQLKKIDNQYKQEIKWGEIKIQLLNIDFKVVEKYQRIIAKLISSGAFDVKNGKVILNFDNAGQMREIEVQVKYRPLDRMPC
jgi:hypothetical protein